jgi:MYXO-CTERM domain-containing protein
MNLNRTSVPAAICLLLLFSVIARGEPVYLDFHTASWPGELMFRLIPFGGGPSDNIHFSSYSPFPNASFADGTADYGDFAGGGTHQFSWDLAPGDYTFTVYDSYGDGGNGLYYTMFVNGSSAFTGSFPSGYVETTDFSVGSAEPGVPEPATLGLAALGLAGLAVWRTRRTG